MHTNTIFSRPYRLFLAVAEILGAIERHAREEHARSDTSSRRAAFPWPDPETLGTEARAQLADTFAALHLRTTAQALDPGVLARQLRRGLVGEPVEGLPMRPARPWSPRRPPAPPAPPASPPAAGYPWNAAAASELERIEGQGAGAPGEPLTPALAAELLALVARYAHDAPGPVSPSPEYILLVKLARFGDGEALRHLRAVIGSNRSDKTADAALAYARQLPGMLESCTTGTLVDLVEQLANNGPGGAANGATWVRLVHRAGEGNSGALEQLERVAKQPGDAATLAAARAYLDKAPQPAEDSEPAPAPQLPDAIRNYLREEAARVIGAGLLSVLSGLASTRTEADVSPEALAACKDKLSKIRDRMKAEAAAEKPNFQRLALGMDSMIPIAAGGTATIQVRPQLPMLIDQLWIPEPIASQFQIEKLEAMELDAMHGSPAPGTVFSPNNPDGPPPLSIPIQPGFLLTIKVRNTGDTPARFVAAAFGRHPDAPSPSKIADPELVSQVLVPLASKGEVPPGMTEKIMVDFEKVGFLCDLAITEGAEAFSIDAILIGNQHQLASNDPIPGALFSYASPQRPRLRTDVVLPPMPIGVRVTNTSQEPQQFTGAFVALCLRNRINSIEALKVLAPARRILAKLDPRAYGLPLGAWINDARQLAYVVQPGDYGTKIAARITGMEESLAHKFVPQLIEANPQVKDWREVAPGTDLLIPPSWREVAPHENPTERPGPPAPAASLAMGERGRCAWCGGTEARPNWIWLCGRSYCSAGCLEAKLRRPGR